MPENIDTLPTRRRRYARLPSQDAGPLTPPKQEMLRYLAELRFLSLPQLARLCCPSERRDLSERSARRHMRVLFDAGLVDVLPVPRAALAPACAPNDAALLYGSAPNVYALTAHGLDILRRLGLVGSDAVARGRPGYGPKNSLFLAHELAVRDVRVWLEDAARAHGYEVECWHDAEGAAIELRGPMGRRSVRPDCWFVYRLGPGVLVGIFEVDRGTERGDRRWREKIDAYAELFAGDRLPAATGYVNARVLVATPDARRRDQLAELLAKAAPAALSGRFWLAEQTALAGIDLGQPLWRQPGTLGLRPLVPDLRLVGGKGEEPNANADAAVVSGRR